MDTKALVLVTGGTGFIGSHVILQLLEAGYRVRAAVRPGKTARLKAAYPDAGESLQVCEIEDIASADFAPLFEGVTALLHIAAPILYNTKDAAFILNSTINGTAHIMNQAVKCGIKKVVLTSSVAALFDPDGKQAYQPHNVDETWWGSATFEEVSSNSHNFWWAYMAGKALAEKKAWEIVGEAEDVDLTTILPPLVLGAFIPKFFPPESRDKIGSNEPIYHLIRGSADGAKTYPRLGFTHFASVKDVARAHVLALKAPPLPSGKRKRLIINTGNFTWPQAAEYLTEVRPELAEDLKKNEAGPPFMSCYKADTSLTKEVLGMSEKNMVPWKECVLETVDCLLQWEAHSEVSMASTL